MKQLQTAIPPCVFCSETQQPTQCSQYQLLATHTDFDVCLTAGISGRDVQHDTKLVDKTKQKV